MQICLDVDQFCKSVSSSVVSPWCIGLYVHNSRLNLPSGEVGRVSGRVGLFFMYKLKILAKLIALSGPEGPTLPKGELLRVTNLVLTNNARPMAVADLLLADAIQESIVSDE